MNEIYNNLTKLIKEANTIIFMTHRNMDLDGFGASLCMYEIAKSFNKECYIFINSKKNHKSVEKAFLKLKEEKIDINYIDCHSYKEILKTDPTLIILDIHKPNIVEYPKILDEVKKIIVIDHHIKDHSYIKNTSLSYINANYSSTNEMVSGYLRYLNKKVKPLIATIMLSGIEIDTNSFNVKTSSDTYEAASFLVKMGADNVIKQEFLKESKEEFVRRQEYIKDSFMINKNMAMCLLDDVIVEKEQLAIIAEELLQFDDVEASFAVGKIANNIVGISARSIGKIDVEEIMKELGGGGHYNEAAAQIKSSSIEKIKQKVLDIVGD